MRTTQAVARALNRLEINVGPVGRSVIDEALRSISAPLFVRELPEQATSTAIAYIRLTDAGQELFLPRKSSELAVVHELLHVMLLRDGYFFPVIWHPEPTVETAMVSIVGGMIEAITHPIVRQRMEARGLDTRLFHQAHRSLPEMAHGHGEPTPEEDVSLAVNELLQAVEYPLLRPEIDREFAGAYPNAAALGREMAQAVEGSRVTSPGTYRALLRRLLAMADQHIRQHQGTLPLSLYVPLPPVCTAAELARPAKDFIRMTDTGVLSIVQAGSQATTAPPAVFLVWQADNSTVQVRSVAHSALMLQVKDSLRRGLEQPLEAFFKDLQVPYWVE